MKNFAILAVTCVVAIAGLGVSVVTPAWAANGNGMNAWAEAVSTATESVSTNWENDPTKTAADRAFVEQVCRDKEAICRFHEGPLGQGPGGP